MKIPFLIGWGVCFRVRSERFGESGFDVKIIKRTLGVWIGGMMADMIRVSVPENVSVDYLLQTYLDVFTRFYPNFDEWFMQKVVPNLGTTRRIFLANIGKEIAGICIVKNCQQEKKICSLRVFEPYRRQGVGTALVKHALTFLGDNYPFVTVPEESLPQYESFFQSFNFQLMDSCCGYYRPNKIEYAFNGFLEPKDISYKSIECLEVLSCQ